MTARTRILIFLLLSILSSDIGAHQIIVSKNKRPSTISDALKMAKKGDTLVLLSGVYLEANILIDKSICLMGKGNPVVDAQSRSEIMTVTADSVEITGITLRNVGSSYTKDYAALRMIKSENFWIHHNRFENVFFGIYLQNSHQGKIERNTIIGNGKNEFNSGNGIHLWQSTHIKIIGNLISRARDGIYLEFASNTHVIANNSYLNKRYGLHFMFSNDNSYSDNIFRKNGAGVAVMFSKQIKIYRNRFEENWGSASYGLLLKEIYDADIRNNVFIRNSVAINAEGSNRISYHSNVFEENGWAIKVLGGCYDNSFIGNNFLRNTFDVSYSGQINRNVFLHNYWSAYNGYDLDKDGYGDVPYRPVKLFDYVVNQTPETIILLRSFFVDIINLAEQVTPLFTPDDLMDQEPMMKPYAL